MDGLPFAYDFEVGESLCIIDFTIVSVSGKSNPTTKNGHFILVLSKIFIYIDKFKRYV